MSTQSTNQNKSLGTISPADVPLETLPVVELNSDQLQDASTLAQQRSKTYQPIGGGELFGGQDSLTSHQIGLLGELAVAQFYDLSIDSEIYRLGDNGIDLELFNSTIDVKTTATNALDLPELLVRADKQLNSEIYVRAHVLHWSKDGARVRMIGAAPREVVKNRDPKRHPGSRKNYVVSPHELDLLPSLQTA